MPMFFNKCTYSSFVRQANGWGFRRITKEPDRNGYYHQYFLRGRSDLCRLMKRPRLSLKNSTAANNCEPDFYSMPSIEEDKSLDTLSEKPSSGNRAVRYAEEIHKQKQQKDGIADVPYRQAPAGDKYTVDVESASLAINSCPLRHYEAQLAEEARKLKIQQQMMAAQTPLSYR